MEILFSIAYTIFARNCVNKILGFDIFCNGVHIPATHGSFETLLRVNYWLEVWIIVCFEVSENVVKLLSGEIILSRLFHQHFYERLLRKFSFNKMLQN